MKIRIHQLNPDLQLTERQLKELCREVSGRIELQAASCDVIFVDDETLQEMHARYLNAPTPTDVITFDLGDEVVEGEIYISYQRAGEQAKQYGVTLQQEILRLVIHGLLHLKGYDDIEETDRRKMKQLENKLVEDVFAVIIKKT